MIKKIFNGKKMLKFRTYKVHEVIENLADAAKTWVTSLLPVRL